MHTVMVAAISEDGFLTKGNNPNPSAWTSSEDKVHYYNMLHKNDVYLMGSRTYSVIRNNIPVNAHKIVMSHNVSEQPKTAGVTFSDKAFPEIFKQFESRTSQILVLGGASTYHQLLDQGLINEAYITVEPVLNKSGVRLCNSKRYFEDLGFSLVEEKILNSEGTVLKHYVLKK